jgi:hypothetical protein
MSQFVIEVQPPQGVAGSNDDKAFWHALGIPPRPFVASRAVKLEKKIESVRPVSRVFYSANLLPEYQCAVVVIA